MNTHRNLVLGLATLLAVSPLAAQRESQSEAIITQAARPRPGAEAAQLVAGLGLLSSRAAFPSVEALLSGLQYLPGEGNAAVVDQLGAGNTASVVQQGRQNVAAIYERGDFNDVSAAQEGYGNIFGAWIEGSGNALDVQQIGAGNLYFFGFRGDNLRHSIVQEGTGLRAFQFGEAAYPVSIQQLGNGAEVRIEHNPIVP